MNIYSFNPMALLSPATKLQDGMLFAYICEPIIICVICGIIFFMKGKKKGVLLVLMLMSVFMLLPLGAD